VRNLINEADSDPNDVIDDILGTESGTDEFSDLTFEPETVSDPYADLLNTVSTTDMASGAGSTVPSTATKSGGRVAAGAAKKSNPDGVPPEFTLVGFIDDPEGDHDDPRYQMSEDYDPLLDYDGSNLQYDVWVDKNRVKSQKDFTDENKPYVVFRVKKDEFDATKPPFNKKRDFDFSGLVIFHNGGTAGKKPFSKMPNMRATYDELYRALSMPDNWGVGNISGLPPGDSPTTPDKVPATPPPPAPAAPPPESAASSAGDGGLGAAESPESSPPVTPPAAGAERREGGRNTCCHTNKVLDYKCYMESEPARNELILKTNYFNRGIYKGRFGYNIHVIEDRINRRSKIEVATAANSLLNLQTGDNIMWIKINLQDQSYSSKSGDRQFIGDLERLRSRIKDARVFIADTKDPCFIPDEKIRSNSLVDFYIARRMEEKAIRSRIREILLSSS